MLILIAEVDSAGSNYPGDVPWWCLATLGPLLNRETRRVSRGCSWSFMNIRLTRVNQLEPSLLVYQSSVSEVRNMLL